MAFCSNCGAAVQSHQAPVPPQLRPTQGSGLSRMPNRLSPGAVVLIAMMGLAAVSVSAVWALSYGMSQPVVTSSARSSSPLSPNEPLAKEWAVHPPGYDGIIEEGQDHYAAPTKTDWDELFKTVRADDSQGLLELVMAERAFLLPGGTKVKILDSPFGAQQYEVRVLSGKRSGQRAFVLKKAVW